MSRMWDWVGFTMSRIWDWGSFKNFVVPKKKRKPLYIGRRNFGETPTHCVPQGDSNWYISETKTPNDTKQTVACAVYLYELLHVTFFSPKTKKKKKKMKFEKKKKVCPLWLGVVAAKPGPDQESERGP